MYRILKLFLTVLALANCMSSLAQSQSRLVTRYGPEEGFTTAQVNDILRDSKGLMWFGTTSGLYRFDGYRFDVFKPDDKDSLSLSDVFIRHLFEDSRGNIWIGTLHGGLCRYDPKQRVISRFHDPRDSIGAGSIIHGMAEDRAGNIWVVGLRGIHRYSYASGWSRYRFTEAELPKAIRRQIFSIHVADNGIIWLGCAGRTFMRLDPLTRKVKLYDFNSAHFGSALVRSITTDEKGIVWMTAQEGGLVRFDPVQEKCDIVPPQGQQFYSPLRTTPKNVFVGSQNGLLVFNKEDLSDKKLISNALYDLDGVNVSAMHMESEHIVWLGTAGMGLIRVQFVPSLKLTTASESVLLSNVIKDKQLHFYTYPNHGFSIKEVGLNKITSSKTLLKDDAHIYDALRDNKGNIWLAGSGKVIRLKPERSGGASDYAQSTVHALEASVLTEDDQQRVWAGGMGYFLYNPTTNIFDEFKRGNGGNVKDMEQTTDGIWASLANNGLAQLIPQADTVLRHLHNPADSTTVSDNFVSQLHVDKTGTLWIGTLRGLDRYNPTLKNFTRFHIPSRESGVYRLDEDNKGRLLIQTKDGLVRFTPPSGTAPGHMEKIHSPINLSHGYGFLHYPWFTWQQGDQVAECHLDSIHPASNSPHIVITGFALDPNNKHPLSPEQAQSNPAYWSHIELAYDQNLLNIEFSAPDFSDPDKNEYAYQLKGFDPDWTFSGTRNFVTYTNLDPGKYIFEVRGANAFGVWSEQSTTLSITILPPPWKTWWAYTGYGLIFIGLLFIGRRIVVNRERLKAQVMLEQKEKQTLRELDHLKSKFFSNITHEFRTPLTLIQGPAAELLEKTQDSDARKLIGLIKSNSSRLLKLINQLLDLAKLDAREMKLHNTPVDLKLLINVTVSQFTSLAESRRVTYDWLIGELPVVQADGEKLETILTNLISNAIKFTPRGGKVDVQANWNDHQFIFVVRDTGRGIPAEKLPHIFDRFYQVSPTDASHAEGTGIGLALVKEYVEIMRGVLEVESRVGLGTAFTIKLPLTPGELPAHAVESKQVLSNGLPTMESIAEESGQSPLILLVEDNAELRSFIKTCLGNDYRYTEAGNGRDAMSLAMNQIPDLIISDLMMPEMDGLELCARLKKDKRTDHIPFIMLTAKSAEENKLEGLQTGADEYLVKPFNKAELLLKVQNLITLRQNLQKHIRTSILAQASDVRAESAEEQFVLKARLFVETHLKDETLNVVTLSQEMNLSREQCYRKLSALTGLAPLAFIRKIKLQRAHQLLSAQWGPVSQVAYEAGFENLSHFSKAFKEEFGKLPSEV